MTYTERHANDPHERQHEPITEGIMLDDLVIELREVMLAACEDERPDINLNSMSYEDAVWLLNEVKSWDIDEYMNGIVGVIDVMANYSTCEQCAEYVQSVEDYRQWIR